MSQSRRREAILKILEHGPVESGLADEVACFVRDPGQRATLSRICEMGIVKSAMGYIHEPSYLYLPTPSARLADTLQRDVSRSRSPIRWSLARDPAAQAVGRCSMPICRRASRGRFAGDDTIFLAVDLNADIRGVANEMRGSRVWPTMNRRSNPRR